MSLQVIDLSWANDSSLKPLLLEKLKKSLFDTGFLYLVNHGAEPVSQKLSSFLDPLFRIPQSEKDAIDMVHSPHFLGYTGTGRETTAKRIDVREQYDFGSVTSASGWRPGQQLWKRLKGPSSFPSEKALPGFRETLTEYLKVLEGVSRTFVELVAECLGLPKETFTAFEGEMNRLKLIRYPVVDGTGQGVGPHKDSSGMFTFLLQDDVGGLEALGFDGEWTPVPYIKDSFVVNVAQGFEALTAGKCGATTHRVVSPSVERERFSIAFFYSVKLDLTAKEIEEQCKFVVEKVPTPQDQLKRAIDVASEFIDPQFDTFGDAHLRNRIVSHKDVGKAWYPDLYDRYVSM